MRKQDDLNALVAAKNEAAQAEIPSAEKNSDSIFSGINTAADMSFNTNAAENAPISQAQLSANLSVSKGPFYINYTHSRTYDRQSDAYYGTAVDEWQGSVNNQVTVGVSFTPGFNGGARAVAVNSGNVETVQASAVK